MALQFAHAARDRLPVGLGIAVGLIDVVEGELTGRVVFDAHQLMRARPCACAGRCRSRRNNP